METIRGTVSDLQFTASAGHAARYADNLTSGLWIRFTVGQRVATAQKDEAFPPLNIGDQVEASGEMNGSTGTLEVKSLINHTTGQRWKSTGWSR